ncbi:MAG: HAD family hydrolase [Candidatus Aenigmarchaeota archaeon]|nr:HAD family hydrolase [Candidatus Aenigmarchaeota archaeon]
MWSRQLWLRYLSDKHEINLDGKTISKIIESFWMSAAGNSKIDPKTEKWIKDNEKRLFIITGSDRNLIFRAGKIIYNSKYSKRIKIKRMKAQGLKIQPRNIITGDPYDKDTREFWQNISKRMPQDVIVIDDSTIIVSRAKNCGFRSFLFDPDGKHYEKSFKNRITDLTEISRIA